MTLRLRSIAAESCIFLCASAAPFTGAHLFFFSRVRVNLSPLDFVAPLGTLIHTRHHRQRMTWEGKSGHSTFCAITSPVTRFHHLTGNQHRPALVSSRLHDNLISLTLTLQIRVTALSFNHVTASFWVRRQHLIDGSPATGYLFTPFQVAHGHIDHAFFISGTLVSESVPSMNTIYCKRVPYEETSLRNGTIS